MTKNKDDIRGTLKAVEFEWLKSGNDLKMVFKNGYALVSKDKKLKANYFFKNSEEINKARAGLSVRSDKGNSVWRNRMKRILRESIRKEKGTMISLAKQRNTDIILIFSPYSINQKNFKKVKVKDISASLSDILTRLKEITLVRQK